jgi:hypothetical protein
VSFEQEVRDRLSVAIGAADIHNVFVRRAAVSAAVPEVLAIAHELAERQRAWAREPGLTVRIETPELMDSIIRASVDLAADLIDPKKEKP